MLKFQNYARTVLRSSFVQHVRLFSSPIPQAGSSIVLFRKLTGRSFIDPAGLRDYAQRFGDISKIWSGFFNGSTITFASPEQAQKLLDTATHGTVTTESGESYRVKSLVPFPPPSPSPYLRVLTFNQSVKQADIQDALSNFGTIESVSLEQERPAIGEMPYTVEFVVHFTNAEDAVKANSTFVSLSNGAILQTDLVATRASEPSLILQFLIEGPGWNKIQPGYNSGAFAADLSRLANVPRDDLRYQVDSRFGAGLIEVLVKTKDIEAAQKIKAIQSGDIPNATFVVRYFRANDFPQKRRRAKVIKETGEPKEIET
ncbi:hypothetical protein C8J56DRAFT_957826 [Mycena floridula]|nr:hypothetical protein C8J56DRAFT_957826 [Mycena floridula]